nr:MULTISPECIES: hypothetical protein [unclassified Rathayibacter]
MNAFTDPSDAGVAARKPVPTFVACSVIGGTSMVFAWSEDGLKSEFGSLVSAACCRFADPEDCRGFGEGEAVPEDEPDQFGLILREGVEGCADVEGVRADGIGSVGVEVLAEFLREVVVSDGSSCSVRVDSAGDSEEPHACSLGVGGQLLDASPSDDEGLTEKVSGVSGNGDSSAEVAEQIRCVRGVEALERRVLVGPASSRDHSVVPGESLSHCPAISMEVLVVK